mmetsp:Transcript_42718/g.101687  ORF Transcript_42718/g.101687 Transcript_42718/m.101687 type:complete len:203 (+) Transcript_42718:156-764(+)
MGDSPMSSPLRHMVSSATKTAATISTLYAHDEHLDEHAHERDDMVRTLYSQLAVWTDPVTSAEGVEAIVANYRSLACIASSAELQVLTAKFEKDRTGQMVLKFDAIAKYTIRCTPIKIQIRQWSEVKFDAEAHLITSHVDHWSVESMFLAIPLLGAFYTLIFRPIMGILVSLLFSPKPRPPSVASSPAKPLWREIKERERDD